MEYEGSLGLEYQLLVIKDADTLNFFKLDPEDKDITMGEVKTQFRGNTSWRFSGRIGQFTIDEEGSYTFSSLLISSPNESLELSKADLVLKK